jgi:hypothetical protein
MSRIFNVIASGAKQSSAKKKELDCFVASAPRNDGATWCERATLSTVIVRLAASAKASASHDGKPRRSRDRAIQYSRASVMESKGCGVLDNPPSRV